MARKSVHGLNYPQPREIGLVQRAVCDALNKRDIFLKPVDPTEWRLSGWWKAASGEDAGPDVVPLATVAGWHYWLSMQLKFTPHVGELRFLSASLTVSRNALASEEKKRLLRAEWEHRDGPQHRRHGQPHWHVYVAELAHRELERFHLAMAACWHLGEIDSHYRIPSPEGLASWVGECVKYIKNQLESIGRVTGTAAPR